MAKAIEEGQSINISDEEMQTREQSEVIKLAIVVFFSWIVSSWVHNRLLETTFDPNIKSLIEIGAFFLVFLAAYKALKVQISAVIRR